jgi:CRP/FNR family transcriptional regulator, nitrogen oxide reductase regulator
MQLHQPLANAASRLGANRLSGPSLLNDRIALVQRYALFCDISATECASILASAHERHFSRHQIIFLAGDPIRQTLLLTSGNVKVTQAGQNGCEVILRLNGAGESVGPLGMSTRGEHCASAHALETCTALAWDASAFEALAERHPVLRRNMIRILETHLQEMDARFREISTEKVSPRLSSQIVRLLNQVGKRNNGHIEISLSREELAQLTGTTLFTVSRLLCQWEVRGIVSARREAVLVRNIQALIELSQEE